MCFFVDPSPVRRVPIPTGIQRKLNFVSVRTIKGSSSAQASDYPTIAAVESRVRRRIALLFRETCSRFHRCKCRNAVPHLEGTQDVFGKVAMGEESASRRDIALNFTAEVSVYGTFVCAVKSGQKVCAESI